MESNHTTELYLITDTALIYKYASASPGGLAKTQIAGCTLRVSDVESLWWRPDTRISKFTDDEMLPVKEHVCEPLTALAFSRIK